MPRGLDHLVLAVRDLDAAARFYERMGFQVGGRNRHPWGTENRLVQLPGVFLEIITVGEGAAIPPHEPGAFSFGAFVRDSLARREGFAMLVLDSENAKADAELFRETGIGAFAPFHFERKGQRPDGSEIHVAFTLAFAQDEAARQAAFFVCQQHYPENFWNPAFQQHPNGAKEIAAVAFAAPDPERHRAFLTVFTGTEPTSPNGGDLSFALARGRLDVMGPDEAAELYVSIETDPDEPALVAFAVRVEDLRRQVGLLQAAEIPHQAFGGRAVVPSSAAFGVAIAFEEA
ncbi:MAG TPA: VOC family protein [Microvirga sp.]|jgi:catechol 2,3-dioxygenase-like lactoylglutathione lyase family enzyme